MERLTYKLGNHYGLNDEASSKVGLFTDYDGFYAYLVAVNKLGRYEDLAEQGRLGGIEEYQKRLVRYIDAGKHRSADKKVFSENDVVYLIEHGIFPCKSEADRALAERQKNE